MQPLRITQLKDAIRSEHRCEALYIKTVHISQTSAHATPDHGLVMVFELVGHSETECCYAWTCREGDRIETLTALKIPPVTSPEAAVLAASADREKS